MNQPSTDQAIRAVARQGRPAEPEAPKPRRPRRWVWRVLGLLVLLIALLVALAPTLLSTGPGTAALVSIINGRGVGEIQIDTLSLRWGKGQRVTGLAYTDTDKASELTIREIVAKDLSLFSLIRGGRKLGDITVADFKLVYDAPSERERDERDEPSDPDQADAPFRLPPDLSGTVTVNNARVEYRAAGQDPAVLTLPTGTVQMPDLRDIAFDFNASLQQGLRRGTVRFTGGVLNLFDPDGLAQPFKASYDIDSEVAGLSIGVLDSVVSGLGGGVEPGLVAAVLGDGELEASATAAGTIDKLLAELHIQTPNLDVDLFQVRDGDTLIASPQSSARLRLTTQAFGKLFPDSPLTLAKDEMLTMRSLKMRLPTVDGRIDLDASSMFVQLGADSNLLLKDPNGEVIGIDGLQVRGGTDSIATQLAFEVSATLAAKAGDGRFTREPVRAELIVNNPLVAEREIVFFSEKLPIQLADALAGQDGRLVMWLGEMLALRVDVRGQWVRDASGRRELLQAFSLLPEGRVNGEVVGAFNRGRLTLATMDKAPIQAVLVPEAFASLMAMLSGKPGQPALTIDQPMPVRVTLRDAERGEVSIVTDRSRQGAQRLFVDPDRTYLGATIELPAARVYDPALDKTYELRGGTLSVSAPDLRGRAEIKADLRLWVRPDAGREGVPALLSWRTTVADILGTDGAIPLNPAAFMRQIALDGGVALDNAPSGLFDALLNRDGDIASILGPIVQDLTAGFTYSDGRPTGATVKLNWDEKTNQPIGGAWASMTPVQFDVDADQMLTVRGGKDIDLSVKVTEAFGDRWMGKLHPILFDAKSGDRPVQIKIDGSSFRFPLNDPTMKGARVNAEVDLGSIAFGEGALLGKLLAWSGRPGERAVFEPAKVSLVDGRIRYDQFDMAVGNVQLRLDGEVDLASGDIVQMAVRVPGRTLTKVFNELEGVIAPDDFLSIPMSGSIRSPSFDRKLIVREVARLATRGLINREKGKLRNRFFDKVREELGLEDKEPAENPEGEKDPAEPAEPGGDAPSDPAQDEPAAPQQEPKPAEDRVRDELIERGLDLLFGGGRGGDEPKEDE